MAIAAPRSRRSKEIRRHVLVYMGLSPYLVIAVFPILWMLITALKQEPDLYRMDVVPFWFHLPPTLKNFEFLFRRTFYGDWIVNTMSISLFVSGITLLTAVPAGYALARLRLPFAENLGIAIFMTYLVPAIILFIPLSRVVSELGLQDTWWSLVVVYPTFTIPFCTWLLMGFFKTVPFEIEEAGYTTNSDHQVSWRPSSLTTRESGMNRMIAGTRYVMKIAIPKFSAKDRKSVV